MAGGSLGGVSGDVRIVLVRVSGRDRPGITTGLLGVLAGAGVDVYDMEQVVVRERLTLDLLIGVPDGSDVLKELLFHGWETGIQLDFEVVEPTSSRGNLPRSVVTVIGRSLPPAALRDVTGAIAGAGGNILMGTAEDIAEQMQVLSDAGLDGVLCTWVDFHDGLRRFTADLMPLLERRGLRAPFRRAA